MVTNGNKIIKTVSKLVSKFIKIKAYYRSNSEFTNWNWNHKQILFQKDEMERKITEQREIYEKKLDEYREKLEIINLLNAERGRGYSSWLSEARKNVKKADYRSEVY